jgi:hypothetical protein
MNQQKILAHRGDGYTKNRGQIDAERFEMGIEAQPEMRVSDSGIDPRISLRVFVTPGPGDRPHIDVQESAVELSLKDARNLADWLVSESNRLAGH